MENMGHGGEKKAYRAVLLLVVGLAAFSSAMKELNQVRELALQTSQTMAELSEAVMPVERTTTFAKLEACESRAVAAPAPNVPIESNEVVSETPVVEAKAPETTPAAPAPRVRVARAIKLKIADRVEADSVQFRAIIPVISASISSDELVEKSLKAALDADPTLKLMKLKNRRHVFISPEGREMIFKTLNRAINLRSAS